jgi:hypothetical protein
MPILTIFADRQHTTQVIFLTISLKNIFAGTGALSFREYYQDWTRTGHRSHKAVFAELLLSSVVFLTQVAGVPELAHRYGNSPIFSTHTGGRFWMTN